MKISIIGSFQKYYEEIKELISLLTKHGFEVLSPKLSKITHSIEDFVIFESDNHNLSPEEIQTETLNKILKSDLVYVFDPGGYVGRTTCYEIGVLRTTNIPLIFFEKPKDLPIEVPEKEIMKPKKLIFEKSLTCVSENQLNIEKQKIKNEMQPKNIVICGSMAFYDRMQDVAKFLKNKGVSVVIPKEESWEKEILSAEEFNIFKGRVSNQYLGKIRESSTYAVLILNEEKKGKKNYIGANTLVEIAMAFCWGRPIYLYNDYYDPLIDELLAWNVVCLNQNLDKLIRDYKESKYRLLSEGKNIEANDVVQLELGDIDERFYPLFR